MRRYQPWEEATGTKILRVRRAGLCEDPGGQCVWSSVRGIREVEEYMIGGEVGEESSVGFVGFFSVGFLFPVIGNH